METTERPLSELHPYPENAKKHPLDQVSKIARSIQEFGFNQPTWWFIENPRGMLRKMPWMEEFLIEQGGVRHTVAYCQYGDSRQKPTDVWTNAWWWQPHALCKPGSVCHEAAPRGSRTGTQGLADAAERGRIPAALFEQIFEQLPT